MSSKNLPAAGGSVALNPAQPAGGYAANQVVTLNATASPIGATVNSVIEKGGGNVWFVADGVVAAFIIIVAIALIFIYIFLRKLSALGDAIHDFGNLLTRF